MSLLPSSFLLLPFLSVLAREYKLTLPNEKLLAAEIEKTRERSIGERQPEMTDSPVYLINAWHFVWTKSSLRLCFHQHTRQASDSVMLKCGGFFFLTADFRSLISDCSASGSVDREHLETDNVLGPIYKAFGEQLPKLLDELNEVLAA